MPNQATAPSEFTRLLRGGRLPVRQALVGFVLALLLAGIAVGAWDSAYTLPLVMGSAYTGVLNLQGVPWVRVRGMAWTVLWLTVATLIGGLVSPYRGAEIVVVALVGLVGGYVGVLGPRAATVGVFAMSSYCVFGGLDFTVSQAVKFAALMGLGGVSTLVLWTAVILVRDPRAFSRPAATEPLLERLRVGRPGNAVFLRHAVRLSLALVAGSVIAHHMQWPHPYWIPMTIALMSRPDAQGTASRVGESLLGTFLGVGVAVLFVGVAGDSDVLVAVSAAVGVLLLLMFQTARYSLAVTGTTLTVLTGMTLLGDPLLDTSQLRLLMTAIAGALSLIAAVALWWVSTRHPIATEPANPDL